MKAPELRYDIGDAEPLIHDRAAFERRAEHYARFVLEQGRPFSFLHRGRGRDDVAMQSEIALVPGGRGVVYVNADEPITLTLEHGSDAVGASTLLDELDDAILATDANPSDYPGPLIIYANRGFERMSGHDPRAIIGATPRILQGPGTEPEARKAIGDSLAAWSRFRIALTNYKVDGTPFTVELLLTPVADETGWYTHWLSVQRDVSEREFELDLMATSHRVALLGEWSLDLTDHVNNALADFHAELESLIENVPELPAQRVRALQDSAEQIGDRMRRFTRHARHPPTPVWSPAETALRRAAEVLPRGDGATISNTIELSVSPLCSIPATEHALADLFMTFYLDARAAAAPARPTLTLDCRCAGTRGDPMLQVTVRYGGEPLPDRVRADPFALAHPGSSPKRGVGFFAVARRIQSLGGSIRLLPERSASVFEIQLPARGPAQPP